MKKLSTGDDGKRAALATELDTLFDELATVHEKLSTIVPEYNEIAGRINEKISDVKELVGGVTAAIDSYIDDKSENWQDSDTGQGYSAWRNAWEELDTDDIELLDEPDALDTIPAHGVSEALMNLPHEPD